MAASEEPNRGFINYDASREEIIRNFFEPQLARLGLSADQIEQQNLEELNESLKKINDAIAQPQAFGTLKMSIGPTGLFVVKAESHFEVGILPLLLERKALILRRIKTLGGERRIETLKDLVATVADADLRTKIEGEVSALAEQSRRLAEQESTLSQAQAEQIAKRDEALAKLRAEIFERRLKAWTNFFAKESVATYIGAFLLIVVMLVQIIAMFTGDKYKSEIINNAFLLLLGYFFGQGGARAAVEQTKSGGG